MLKDEMNYSRRTAYYSIGGRKEMLLETKVASDCNQYVGLNKPNPNPLPCKV